MNLVCCLFLELEIKLRYPKNRSQRTMYTNWFVILKFSIFLRPGQIFKNSRKKDNVQENDSLEMATLITIFKGNIF